MLEKKQSRLIAFYLPQYHPIPENDEWWGKGFTEWTNVAKAKPLFKGHYQPHLPADLGFYDLRVPVVRQAQADMAREAGIEGFCYWHYWFAGKQLLDRPFKEVLQSGKPDFPFCLAWANETWTGIWNGNPNRILIEQTYPGQKDVEDHFYALLDAFQDPRYIHIDDKPIFIIYKPENLPEPRKFVDSWKNLAQKNGLKGIYFIGCSYEKPWNPIQFGFDASSPNELIKAFTILSQNSKNHVFQRILRLQRRVLKIPRIYDYRKVTKMIEGFPLTNDFMQFPSIVPNWDNTPRSGRNGIVLHNSSPELFRLHLKYILSLVSNRPFDKRVIFLKSWNEWAEGNHLEPDQKFQRAYLDVLKQEVLDLVYPKKSDG